MRVLRLTAVLVAAVAVGGGAVACSRTVEGTGTIAAGAGITTADPSGSPTGTPDPSATGTSTPAPSPTPDPILRRRLALCVAERSAITSINSNFNKAKTRDGQITVLRNGARTVTGHLRASKLSVDDRIYKYGKAVLDHLNGLVRSADAGQSPSTKPYNAATANFQKACSTL